MNTVVDGLNEIFIQDAVIKLHNNGIINLKNGLYMKIIFLKLMQNFKMY